MLSHPEAPNLTTKLVYFVVTPKSVLVVVVRFRKAEPYEERAFVDATFDGYRRAESQAGRQALQEE
jgi:hypothetical protein